MEEIIAHVVQPVNWMEIVISGCSVFISIVAIIISVITYRSQKQHNRNSVRPILSIIFGDYEDDLYVRIDNNGVGPAIIRSVTCIYKSDDRSLSSNNLVDLIPSSAKINVRGKQHIVRLNSFSDFIENIAGRALPPGGSITLLRIEEPENELKIALRNFLKECSVIVEYTDIYNSETWKSERELDFFGRTLCSEIYQITYVK